jgi:hypoxanthine phosphoribosyltransferase
VTPEKPTPLFSEEQIRGRVEQLAARISADYAEADELYIVGILKGAFMLVADLARRLRIDHRVDFVALALRASIAGRHVLVVDDIIDTGSTLAYLMGLLRAREPASLRSCVLVSKDKPRRSEVRVDYVGFEIPDVWVVGYGLDRGDRYRTLPYIGSVAG